MENPLGAGEIAFAVTVGSLGFLTAKFIGRFFATKPVASPNGTTMMVNGIPIGATKANDVATLTYPNWKSALGQTGVAGLAGATAYYAHSPMVRASAQGAMIGALLSLVQDYATPLIAGLFKNTALGQRLFLAELEAREAGANGAAAGSGAAATANATTATINTGPGTFAQGVTTVLGSGAATGATGAGASMLSGLPRNPGLASPPFVPSVAYRDVGPTAQQGLAAAQDAARQQAHQAAVHAAYQQGLAAAQQTAAPVNSSNGVASAPYGLALSPANLFPED